MAQVQIIYQNRVISISANAFEKILDAAQNQKGNLAMADAVEMELTMRDLVEFGFRPDGKVKFA